MKIICTAKNYGAHNAEMSSRAEETPVFFMKPDTALLRNNDPFYVPDFSAQVDYECELVVRINRVGRAIAPKFAHRYYDEVGLGIDFTARDLQREAKAAGLPWEAAKAFDRSAALSAEFIKLADLGNGWAVPSAEFASPVELGGRTVQDLRFEMTLNGEVRQRGYTGEMIFTVDEIIAHVSRFVTLKIGDLIYTGTPAGVGRVQPGDRIAATLEGRTLLDFAIK
ncbi:MAG: fumarylacetoacetate hydrolase family protein [Alistipes sp.]|jgi:2-keto-4-pentenoate hydratase/2-oxohepta-3-ene-1,7-dioic acid hydratase in catechol pathway|nr:fumarylacetoacetate hydrolase family protein [Alistipes sp.]